MRNFVAAITLAIVAALPAQAQVKPYPAEFRRQEIQTEGATLHVRVGGSRDRRTRNSGLHRQQALGELRMRALGCCGIGRRESAALNRCGSAEVRTSAL